MPVYEYECRSCERYFDTLTSMAQADQATCPHCASTDARRLLSVIGGLGSSSSGSAASAPARSCGGGACAHCS